jgi:DNA-binding response OmpR family regulator
MQEDKDAIIAGLQEQVELLQAANDNLRDALVEPLTPPPEIGLTKALRYVAGHILARKLATRSSVMDGLYINNADPPESNIVDVYISKLRKKLKPYGIEIKNDWGNGWYMTPEDKRKFRALCAPERKAAA